MTTTAFCMPLNLQGSTIFEAYSAKELDERSYKLRHLPKPTGAHTYTVRDRTARRQGGRTLLTRHDTIKAGQLQISNVVDYAGTEIGIIEPGIEYHCFSLFHAGAMSLSAPGDKTGTVGDVGHGTIHRGQAGLRALTLDGTSRTNLWVTAERVEAALAEALSETPRVPLAFETTLNWEAPTCAALRRLILHAKLEFAQEDGIASHLRTLAAFTDLFVQTALQRLPHNYSARLSRPPGTATPKHLKRAEEFIRAHALEPLTMEQIATAAGCSVRTLQLAYRRFRDTTPHSALVDVRLDRARHDLAASGEAVGSVARRWGFTNASRFTALYRRRFGETPAAAERRANGA